jgi:hypothetical protein
MFTLLSSLAPIGVEVGDFMPEVASRLGGFVLQSWKLYAALAAMMFGIRCMRRMVEGRELQAREAKRAERARIRGIESRMRRAQRKFERLGMVDDSGTER